MYDPTIGRWISQDPMEFDAGDSNLYRYVHNTTTNARDPSGMEVRIYLDDVTVAWGTIPVGEHVEIVVGGPPYYVYQIGRAHV